MNIKSYAYLAQAFIIFNVTSLVRFYTIILSSWPASCRIMFISQQGRPRRNAVPREEATFNWDSPTKEVPHDTCTSRQGVKPIAWLLGLALALFQIWFTTGFGVLDGSMMRVAYVAFITALIFL